jgi:hypothetical protein
VIKFLGSPRKTNGSEDINNTLLSNGQHLFGSFLVTEGAAISSTVALLLAL